jgi:curved DNA-binding protein CbpA
MTRQHTDYYALLQLGRGASAADIDRAYRRAARATHPDVHPDDAAAAERFHAVTLAHETLSDPRRRAAYDHAHPTVRRATPARIVVHRHTSVAPVQLGHRRPEPEPLQPFRHKPVRTQPGDVFELAQALSRILFHRALR